MFSVDHAELIKDDTSDVTLTCDTRKVSPRMRRLSLMQISKVLVDGSLSPVVEYFTGTTTPTFVRGALYSQSSVSLNTHNDAMLSLHMTKPVTGDSGTYRCIISYLDVNHEVKTQSADAHLKV